MVVISLAYRKSLPGLFQQWTGAQPPTVLLIEESKEIFPELGVEVTYLGSITKKLKPAGVYLLDLKTGPQQLKVHYTDVQPSIMFFGETSTLSAQQLLLWSGAQLLVQDI